jgi:hypothetical protein
MEQIAAGFTLVKTSPLRFYKIFNNLNIVVKNNLKSSIEFNPRKKVFNNKYFPIKININFLIKINYYLKIIKNRIIYFINKYNLNKIK